MNWVYSDGVKLCQPLSMALQALWFYSGLPTLSFAFSGPMAFKLCWSCWDPESNKNEISLLGSSLRDTDASLLFPSPSKEEAVCQDKLCQLGGWAVTDKVKQFFFPASMELFSDLCLLEVLQLNCFLELSYFILYIENSVFLRENENQGFLFYHLTLLRLLWNFFQKKYL